MKLKIIAVGKVREKWLKAGIDEYAKRIGKFCQIEIIQINDAPESLDVNKAIATESEKILSALKDTDLVVALDINGEKLDSNELSQKLDKWFEEGMSKVTFVIGGSNGFSDDVIKRSNFQISMSDMTFPHQLARLIFLEQIFRAFKISRGEKYHK